MKIKYKFVTGERVEFEVNDEFAEIMIELDHKFNNHNRKETRRHESLDLSDKDYKNGDINTDVCDQVLKRIDKDKLHNAIKQLTFNEQDLLHKLPYKQFLGYEKGEDGQPKIVEKEAKTVRLIYKLFLEGKTFCAISRFLNDSSVATPSKRGKWAGSTVQSILTNEKYKGDAILQKTFCVDFLTKRMKKNEGELPQFYVENSHPAIISPEIFDMVQNEVTKRKGLGLHNSSAGIFSSKIICGDCGNFFGSKVWHSNSKYKRTIWQCNSKFKNKKKC